MNRIFKRQKFHVRKVKCLVRATERIMSVRRIETSDDRLKLGQNLTPKTVPKCNSSQHQHSVTWYKLKMGSTQRLLGLLLGTMANSCPARVQ